jgi:hypothetical protein
MKRRKSRNVEEISVPITDLPLEEFEKIIHSGCVEGEIPFDLLAEHYPDLMIEWYPGYPGTPRPMTEEDPIPAQAQVQNGKIILTVRGMGDLEFPNDILDDGTYAIWLRIDGEGEWDVCGICSVE